MYFKGDEINILIRATAAELMKLIIYNAFIMQNEEMPILEMGVSLFQLN